jgi:hypothetical protein
MRGAKTEKLRKIPAHARWNTAVCTRSLRSAGGDPKHPVWYSNVVANPQVELQDVAE